MAEGFRSIGLFLSNRPYDNAKELLFAIDEEDMSSYSEMSIKPMSERRIDRVKEKQATDQSISTASEKTIYGRQMSDAVRTNRSEFEDMPSVKVSDNNLPNVSKQSSVGMRSNSWRSNLYSKTLTLCSTARRSIYKTDKNVVRKSKRAYSWPYDYTISDCPSSVYATWFQRFSISYYTEEQAHELQVINATNATGRNYLDSFYKKFGKRHNEGGHVQYYARQDSGISVITCSSIADNGPDLLMIAEDEEPANDRENTFGTCRDVISEKDENSVLDENAIPMTPSEIVPKLKVAFKYFVTRRELRVMLTDVMNIDKMGVYGMKVFAKLSLIPGIQPVKKSTTVTIGRDHTFNGVFCFNVDDENTLQGKRLMLKLVEKRRYVAI